MRITCIVLTRNNPEEFCQTLASVLSQRPRSWSRGSEDAWPWTCELLCIDGSGVPLSDEEMRAPLQGLPFHVAARFSLRRIHQFPPQGVYPAMNLGVSQASGDWLIFMNAGDTFSDPSALDRLQGATQDVALARRVPPRIVFGQAMITPERGQGPPWLVPDPSVRRIDRWLRFLLPNHQSVLVERSWASSHPFRLDAPQSADRAWLRLALAPPGAFAYLPEPVAIFHLGGLSSGLPDWRILRIRLAEPSRTLWEKLAEVAKYILRPLAQHYPLMMRMKSRIIGFLCS